MFEDDMKIATRPDCSDDGCDWTARLVWSMNSRARVRLGEDSTMPALKQVMKPVKPAKKAKSKNRARTFEFGDAA